MNTMILVLNQSFQQPPSGREQRAPIGKCLAKIVTFLLVFCLISLTSVKAEQFEIALEPGEGGILLIGQDKDLDEVKAKYLSADSPAPNGPLESLLLGFYSGADFLALKSPEYVDRMLATYKAAGATTVWAYNGNMQGGKESPASRFAAIAAKYGFKVILEPGDLYFRDQGCWTRQIKASFVKEYQNSEDYMKRYLLPRLAQWAPDVHEDKNIWAWGPVEELPTEDEVTYIAYKKAFKEFLPNHKLYQLDSQQCISERIRHKWRPYPDIVGIDCYPWCIENFRDGLSTPAYAARWMYGYLKGYAGAAYELLDGAPAVFVAQGCAELSWIEEEDGKKLGWKAKDNFRVPDAPNVVWRPELRKFSEWGRYLAPTNAWRLQSWLGICAGFKGLSFWSAGPCGSKEELKTALREGKTTRVCLIDDELNTLPYLQEVMNSWKEIRRFEKLLLSLHPAHVCHECKVNSQHVFTNTFRDSAGLEYLIVVNGSIITYVGDDRQTLFWPKTKLAVDDTGQLTNYTPLKAKRIISIEINTPGLKLYDLRESISRK